MTDASRPTVETLARQDVRLLETKGRKAINKKLSTLSHLEIVYVNPSTIFPNAYNPNRQDDDEFNLLLSSMSEDGFTTPILVHQNTKEIIDGEHRWRAAQRLGLTEIPVVFTTMTPEQMRIATLRHNRARGSEDIELTINILKDLRTLGSLEQAINSLGLDDEEINALIDDLPAPEAQAAEEHSQAWLVDAPNTEERMIPKKRKLVSFSNVIQENTERLQQNLQSLPETDEIKRHAILASAPPIHSTILQIPTLELPLVEKVLGTSNIAQTLLRLCLYHRKKIGAL